MTDTVRQIEKQDQPPTPGDRFVEKMWPTDWLKSDENCDKLDVCFASMINEAMAARDLIRVHMVEVGCLDFPMVQTHLPHPKCIKRYVMARRHTERAFREVGMSVEAFRWDDPEQSTT